VNLFYQSKNVKIKKNKFLKYKIKKIKKSKIKQINVILVAK